MSVSRRELLIAAGAGLALTGCSKIVSQTRRIERPTQVEPTIANPPAVAFLNRYAFGPCNRDLASFNQLGEEVWFDRQLSPTDEEPNDIKVMIGRLDIEAFTPWELHDLPPNRVVSQMQQKALLMATYSPWQLRERMVDFWTNHFSIFANKGLAAYRKPKDEREVVRAHALGKFGDMLRASAQSTAMLVYLDQQNSSSGHPNENYARELMELHTLGVNGGYSQKDVMEVARCFTGWTEERRFLYPKGNFRFEPELHDDREKIVLGHVIPAGGGETDGQTVLKILAAHPSTAHHVSDKLCRYFLGDSYDLGFQPVKDAYLATGGGIKAMMQALYKATQTAQLKPRVKRPFDFIVSSLRTTEADTDGGEALQEHLRLMGQPIYLWAMPDGFPIRDDAWTGSVLPRWRYAIDLAAGKINGTSLPAPAVNSDPLTLVRRSAGSTHAGLETVLSGMKHADAVALLLSAPEFQWH